MYYFENDPLQDVYTDLHGDKSDTNFDAVLRLKGIVSIEFKEAVTGQNYYSQLEPSRPRATQKASADGWTLPKP